MENVLEVPDDQLQLEVDLRLVAYVVQVLLLLEAAVLVAQVGDHDVHKNDGHEDRSEHDGEIIYFFLEGVFVNAAVDQPNVHEFEEVLEAH